MRHFDYPKEYNRRLSPAEEKKLIALAQTGDSEAMTTLICHLSASIEALASFYDFRGLEFRDLCQEGAIGVIKAVMAFDLTRDNRLVTFALYYIKERMGMYIEKQKRGDGIIVSIDEAGSEAYYIEDGGVGPAQAAEMELSEEELSAIIDRRLSPKEANVLRRRIGICGADVETLDSIGMSYNCTRQYIHYIESRAIDKIRDDVRGFRAA